MDAVGNHEESSFRLRCSLPLATACPAMSRTDAAGYHVNTVGELIWLIISNVLDKADECRMNCTEGQST